MIVLAWGFGSFCVPDGVARLQSVPGVIPRFREEFPATV